jgi:hypothetical protein
MPWLDPTQRLLVSLLLSLARRPCVVRWETGSFYIALEENSSLYPVTSRDTVGAVAGSPRVANPVRSRRLAVALAVADAARFACGTRGGDPTAVALDVHLYGRNAKLVFSAILEVDAHNISLYRHPKHRRSCRKPDKVSII